MRHHVTISSFERWRPSTSLRRVSGGTLSRKNDRASSRNACSSFVNARSIGSSCECVVPAKAGTHYHRPSLCEGNYCLSTTLRLRSVGPVSPQDDNNYSPT